jgi:ribosome recycling factor
MEILFFLNFQNLTAERRKDLVKIISETSEKFKVSIRNIRRKYIDLVKDLEKDKSISIDESKKNQDEFKNQLIIQFIRNR